MPKRNLVESRYFLCMTISILASFLLSYSSTLANTDTEATSEDIYEKDDDSMIGGMSQWSPYTRLLDDEFGLENSEDKRGRGFNPLRGKKLVSEVSNENHLSYLYPLLAGNAEAKKAMSFVPMRGRKASYFVPSRGRKSSAFTPMNEEGSSHPSDSQNWVNNVVTENGRGSSSEASERNALGDVELTMQEGYVKDENQSLSDGLDKRRSGFFGSRGKRKVFPFITTWRVFQRMQSPQELKGSKRQSLFFASRGKRDFQTP